MHKCVLTGTAVGELRLSHAIESGPPSGHDLTSFAEYFTDDSMAYVTDSTSLYELDLVHGEYTPITLSGTPSFNGIVDIELIKESETIAGLAIIASKNNCIFLMHLSSNSYERYIARCKGGPNNKLSDFSESSSFRDPLQMAFDEERRILYVSFMSQGSHGLMACDIAMETITEVSLTTSSITIPTDGDFLFSYAPQGLLMYNAQGNTVSIWDSDLGTTTTVTSGDGEQVTGVAMSGDVPVYLHQGKLYSDGSMSVFSSASSSHCGIIEADQLFTGIGKVGRDRILLTSGNKIYVFIADTSPLTTPFTISSCTTTSSTTIPTTSTTPTTSTSPTTSASTTPGYSDHRVSGRFRFASLHISEGYDCRADYDIISRYHTNNLHMCVYLCLKSTTCKIIGYTAATQSCRHLTSCYQIEVIADTLKEYYQKLYI